MLFGIGFYSLLVGSLTSVLSTIDVKKTFLQQVLNQATVLSNTFELGNSMRKLLKREVENFNRNQETMGENQRTWLLSMLSKELKYDICLGMNGEAAMGIGFFAGKDTVLVNLIVPRLDYVCLKAIERVYSRSDDPDGVYFIVEGRVSYVIGDNISVKAVVKGGHFGEIELTKKTTRKFTMVTTEITSFLFMNRALFYELLNYSVHLRKEIVQNSEKKHRKNKDATKQLVELLSFVEIKKVATYEGLAGASPKELLQKNVQIQCSHPTSARNTQVYQQLKQIKHKFLELSKMMDKLAAFLPSDDLKLE